MAPYSFNNIPQAKVDPSIENRFEYDTRRALELERRYGNPEELRAGIKKAEELRAVAEGWIAASKVVQRSHESREDVTAEAKEVLARYIAELETQVKSHTITIDRNTRLLDALKKETERSFN